MAYTVSTIVNTVIGDKRMWMGRVTADAATGVVTVPGAVSVDAIVGVSPASMATENTGVGYTVIQRNANASNVAAKGVLGFSGCTTTKVLNVTVIYH